MLLKHSLLISALALTGVVATSTSYANTAPTQTQQASIRYDQDMDIFHPVYAQNGMVATEQALATQVGLEILK